MEVTIDPPRDGRENMRRDEAMLERAAAGAGPMLRFYRWDGPWISLGRLQDPRRALDLPRLEASGIPWVRRPTGGKALLHDGDLTYSIALPPSHPLLRVDIRTSYEILSRPLVEALVALGVPVALSGVAAHAPRGHTAMREWNPPCFALEDVDAVQIDGRKLIGSAQVRRGGALLQHGSIAITRPPRERLLLLYTGAPEGEERFLADFEAHLASPLAIDPDILIERLIPAFERV